MPRHVVRDRARNEGDLREVLETMNTYEDAACDPHFEENFSWRKDWERLFEKPKPAKIYEISYLDDCELTIRKSEFFSRKRFKDKKVDDESDSESDSEEESTSSPRTRSTTTKKRRRPKKAPEEPDSAWHGYIFMQKTMFWSRVYIMILQFVSSYIFGDMFHTDAFRGAELHMARGYSPLGDFITTKLFAGLRRWDAQYFLFLVDGDYVYETSLMFFPGIVGFVNFVKLTIKAVLKDFLDVKPYNWFITAFAFVWVNWVFFHLVGFLLFFITYQITRNVKVGLLAVSIYSYNPASIFFSAAYSEAGYAFTTFSAMLIALLSCRLDRQFVRASINFASTMFFSFSVLFRSNGLLNIGFAIWYMIGAMLWDRETPVGEVKSLMERLRATNNRRAREQLISEIEDLEIRKSVARKELRFWKRDKFGFFTFVILFICVVLIVIMIIPPFVYFGVSMSREFCNPRGRLAYSASEYERIRPSGLVLAGQNLKTNWCRNPLFFGFWPSFYSKIQKKYWDVDFMGYWQWKKIPCFLLAAPALILTFLAIRYTFREVFERRRWYNFWILVGRTDHMVPFALHAAGLMFVGVFVINVEVFTRIIFSSTPFLYIYLALWMDGLTQGDTRGNRMMDYKNTHSMVPFFINRKVWDSGWGGKLFYIYFMSYFIVGTMAHAAWLPFT